jgi:hypothetical protein
MMLAVTLMVCMLVGPCFVCGTVGLLGRNCRRTGCPGVHMRE